MSNKQIIDAHMHINFKLDKPVSDLIETLDNNNIQKCSLIINKLEELDGIKREIELLCANKNRIHLVAGININSDKPLCIYDYLKAHDFKTDLKLHPSMYNYTKKDFDNIYNCISKLNFKNIVIDSLFFSEILENHIGIELAIFLAKKFPEKTIILAHAGSIHLLECQMYTRKVLNIKYDISFTSSYLNKTSVRFDMINFIAHTSDRIMFGSDYPYFEMDRAMNSVKELCDEAKITKEELDDIFYNNANNIFFEES